MLIKLGIIAGLVILGGMIFSTEIEKLFPGTTSTLPDSLGSDVESLGSTATSFVGERLNQSAADIGTFANDTAGNLIGSLEDTQETLVGGAESGILGPLTGMFSDGEQDVAP